MSFSMISGSQGNSKFRYLRSLSRQYHSKCGECRYKDEFISALQKELSRLQTLTNDFTFQLITHGSKPDNLIKAPQAEPNYKSCVYCSSKLLKITPYRLKVLSSSSKKDNSMESNSARLNSTSSLVLLPKNESIVQSITNSCNSFSEFSY